jgi:hypothetical protein
MTRPQWQRTLGRPVRLVQGQWRAARAGRWYGWTRPEWWPSDRHWPFGVSHPHDGRHVTIFVGGRSYDFAPATYGRYRGHRFDGELRPSAQEVATHLDRQGLDPAAAPLLAAVSSLEGGFDAWQTYDRARCSWGFIQFAGPGGLPSLMWRMRLLAPEQYESYFLSAGIEAEPGGLVVRTDARVRRGWGALVSLHDEPALWKPFVHAAHDPVVQGVQVRAAYEHYLLPIRARTITIRGQLHPLGPLLDPAPMGEAALFDHAVHRGPAYTTRLFQHAAHQVGRADPAAILLAARQLEPGDQARWAGLERALAAANDSQRE